MPGNRGPTSREQRRAMERATAKVSRAELNPFEVAYENDQLKAMIRGYDMILRVLVRRSAAQRIAIPRTELTDLPNDMRLNVEPDEDGGTQVTEVKR